MKIAAFSLLALLCTSLAHAQDIPRKEVALVTCKDHPEQTYYCYLPSLYDGKEPLPIMYCFSPDGNGEWLLRAYQNACEEAGWIVVGSNNTSDDFEGGIRCLWDDTHQRLKVQPDRAYATGFSAGSWEASLMATLYPDHFKGIIKLAEGAVESSDGAVVKGLSLTMRMPGEKLRRIAHYLISGDGDGAKNIFHQGKPFLKREGVPLELKIFPGGHELPPREMTDEAVKWMDNLYRRQLKDLARVKAQLARTLESGKAEERAQAGRLLENLKRYARNTKNEAETLKSAEPTRCLELYQVLAKQFEGDEIGTDAERTVSKLKNDEAFQKSMKADKEWLKIEETYKQLNPCEAHKPFVDTRNCGDCQKINSAIGPRLLSACTQLIKKDPEAPAARKCRELLAELGLQIK